MSIYGQRSINGSIGWLGIPAPFCDTGVALTDNLLVPKARWEDVVRVGDWARGSQPVFLIGADVPWHRVSPARVACLPRSPENARTTARRVRDARLWEHCLVQAQNILYAHHTGGDERVHLYDDDWDYLWDEPADQ